MFGKLIGVSISVLSIIGFVIISSLISGDITKEVLFCENDNCDLSNWFTLFVGAIIAILVATFIWKKQDSLKQLQKESSLLYVIQHLLKIQTHLKSLNEPISNIVSAKWDDMRNSKFEIDSTFDQNQITISNSIKKIFQEKESFEKIIERSYYVIDPKIILQLENISERVENISRLPYEQTAENIRNFDTYINEIINDRLQKYYQKLPKRIKDKYT